MERCRVRNVINGGSSVPVAVGETHDPVDYFRRPDEGRQVELVVIADDGARHAFTLPLRQLRTNPQRSRRELSRDLFDEAQIHRAYPAERQER